MRKFFETMISKFKEFWGSIKYFLLYFFINKDIKKVSFPSFISNETFVEERYFDEDSGDFCVKTKHCLCISRKSKIIKNEIYDLITQDQILKSSGLDYNSDNIDIYFWLYPANKSILIERKRVIIELSMN